MVSFMKMFFKLLCNVFNVFTVACNLSWMYLPAKFISFFYIAPPLIIIGIILNVISAVVLGRDKTLPHTIRFLLQMLAVADCAFLISSSLFRLCFMFIFTDWFTINADVRLFDLPYIMKYMFSLDDIAWNAAVSMIVIVTAAQYIAICWPLFAHQYITMCKVRLAVSINWFILVAL